MARLPTPSEGKARLRKDAGRAEPVPWKWNHGPFGRIFIPNEPWPYHPAVASRGRGKLGRRRCCLK